MMRLLGIAVVAVGFAFRWNTLAVALTASLVAGLWAGFSFHELMTMIGQFFLDNRQLTLPIILMVPVIGLLERHGLPQQVAVVIRRTGAATAGRVLWLYQLVRELTSTVGLSIGNHASMVRPLIAPMAEAAGGVPHTAESAPDRSAAERVRAHAAAAENVGNFFADDIVVAVGALLLIRACLETAGLEVDLREIQLWSLPTALWVLVVGAWRYRRLDRWLVGRVRGSALPASRADSTRPASEGTP